MKHYDEFTLELFAIGSEKVADQRDEFESHLKGCNRCKKFYDEIVQFHELVNGEHPLLLHQPDGGNLDLIIKPQYISKNRLTNIIDFSKSFPQRTWKYVLRKPVKSISGFAAALVFLLYILNPKSLFKDKEPSFIVTNDQEESIAIYNKSSEQLWSKRWIKGKRYHVNEQEKKISYSTICDINDDGKYEILTTIPFPSGGESKNNVIQIFDSDGNLIKIREFGSNFYFKGIPFFKEFTSESILIDYQGRKKEIYYRLGHHRSPVIYYRLDKDLNPLGEYWHYGGLHAEILIDLNKDGNEELFTWGLEDITHQGVLIVLDPKKIIGKTESSATPGFGLESSKSELFYLRFPIPKPLDPVVMIPQVAGIVKNMDNEVLNFSWEAGISCNIPIVYNYYFNNEMKLLDIKNTSISSSTIQKLIKTGQIKYRSEKELIQELKNNLEYWDGKEWRKHWVKVRNSF